MHFRQVQKPIFGSDNALLQVQKVIFGSDNALPTVTESHFRLL